MATEKIHKGLYSVENEGRTLIVTNTGRVLKEVDKETLNKYKKFSETTWDMMIMAAMVVLVNDEKEKENENTKEK